MKTYYKVLSHGLLSATTDADHLVTRYKVGEYVSSPEPLTPLCVFDDLECAKSFANQMKANYVYSCSIKGKYKKPWIPWFPYTKRENLGVSSLKEAIDYLVSLKKRKKKFLYLTECHLPSGTVCCSQVKLIKQIV